MKKKILYILILLMIFVPMISVGADTYDNYNKDGLVSCGSNLVSNIPILIPKVVKIGYTIIQVAVPILLVVMGSLDLVKGLYASKEDEIKKGQQTFIKRLIAAALIFFVFAITKVVVSFAADGTSSKILECAECFLEAKCDS